MNRNLKIAAACGAIFLLSFSLTGILTGGGTRPGGMEAAAASPDAAAAGTAERGYVLREYNGNIGVFYDDNQDSPALITDIPLSSLRAVDQQLLRDGIFVDSRDEMLTLLEDFGS